LRGANMNRNRGCAGEMHSVDRHALGTVVVIRGRSWLRLRGRLRRGLWRRQRLWLGLPGTRNRRAGNRASAL
jgi:hypothetical protein